MKRLLFLLIFLTACTNISSVEINEINIPVELAVTQEEKEIGLMNRESLEGGMLFIYKEEKFYNFWMKNTLIPLDIIFINKNLEVTTVHEAVPCVEDPCDIYSGFGKYVLELNLNSNVKEGMKIKFN